MPIPTFVINLADAGERRSRILKRLSSCPALGPEIVEAVDGRLLSPEALKTNVADSRVLFRHFREHSLTPGEIGCALSHLRCLGRMVEREDPVALVLEDDVLLSDEFETAVVGASAFLEELTKPAVVLLSARTHVYGASRRLSDRLSVRRAFTGVGAYAYLVNRSAARRILSESLPLVAPFDHWFWHSRHGVRLFSVIPHPASFSGAGDDSSLREQREEKWRSESAWRASAGRWSWLFSRLFDGQRIRWAFFKLFRNGRYCPRQWPESNP